MLTRRRLLVTGARAAGGLVLGGALHDAALGPGAVAATRAAEDDEVPAVTVGTLGQHGAGKTTLTAALTRVISQTHGGPAYSYAELDSAPRLEIDRVEIRMSRATSRGAREYTHVDCRDGIDHVKNLIAGAEPLDAAIVVVSAVEGETPETREQVAIAGEVGVKHVVGFINQVDLQPDEELTDIAELELRALFSRWGYDYDATIIRGSARESLREGGDADAAVRRLVHALDAEVPDPVPRARRPLWLPIEEVQRADGELIAVAGRIREGRVSQHDEVELIGPRVGAGPDARVVEIRLAGDEVERAGPGDEARCTLRGIDRNELHRGDVVAKRGSGRAASRFAAELYKLSVAEGGSSSPILSGDNTIVRLNRTDTPGTVALLGQGDLGPGQSASAVFDLPGPIALRRGDTFALRRGPVASAVGTVSKVDPDRPARPGAGPGQAGTLSRGYRPSAS